MKPFDADRSYAWIAGIGQRAEQDAPGMAISAEDAEHMQLALMNYCKLQPEKITCQTRGLCSRIALLKSLDSLIETTKKQPADLIVIYFSGHGFRIKGNYFIACYDSENTDLENTAISGADFLAKLNAIDAEKILVLLDCCHAGGVTRVNGTDAVATDMPFDEQSFLNAKANRVVLTACHRSQVSYLSKPVSLFTYALIEGLGGHYFQEGDQDVTLFDLAMYVRERVAVLSRQVLAPHEEAQKPELNVIENNVTKNFRLARHPNGKPKKLFFKEEFSSLRSPDGTKVINLDVPVEQDTDYRAQFNWIQARDIINNGDGNYTVLGNNGTVTIINNNSSTEELMAAFEIMKGRDMLVQELLSMLKQQQDAQSRELLKRVEKAEKESEDKKKQAPGEKEIFSADERERFRQNEPNAVLLVIKDNRYVYLRLSPNLEFMYEIRAEAFSQKVIGILRRLLMEDSMRDDEYAILGLSLFNRLFADANARSQFYEYIKKTKIEPLKIILLFDASSAEFACLPWEYLYCEGNNEQGFFVASDQQLILIRRLVGNHFTEDQQPANAIRILFAVSHHLKVNAAGKAGDIFDEIGLRKEMEALSKAFDYNLTFHMEYFNAVAGLGTYLQQQDRYHVIHFIGFTRLNKQHTNELQYELAFSPALDTAFQNLEWVNHIGLSKTLGLHIPTLCFLHACKAEAGKEMIRNPEDTFIAVSGLAFHLAKKVAGVLAFQAAVDSVHSNIFLRHIYYDLLKGTDLDAAVNRSLREMATDVEYSQQYGNRTFGISAVYSSSPTSLKYSPIIKTKTNETRFSSCQMDLRRGSSVKICNNEIALKANGASTKIYCPQCDNPLEQCPNCDEFINEKMKERNHCYSCNKPIKLMADAATGNTENILNTVMPDLPLAQNANANKGFGGSALDSRILKN